MRAILLSSIVLLAAAPVHGGEKPSGNAAPMPASALLALSVFEGTWTCETIGPEGAAATGSRTRTTLKRDLGGFWYAGRTEEDSPDREAPPRVRLFFWGYDDVLGKFISGWLDDGGGWSAPTSMGWENDKLVFLGHVTTTGEKVSARETFTRPAAGEFLRTYEVLGFTLWRTVTQERCRHQPPS